MASLKFWWKKGLIISPQIKMIFIRMMSTNQPVHMYRTSLLSWFVFIISEGNLYKNKMNDGVWIALQNGDFKNILTLTAAHPNIVEFIPLSPVTPLASLTSLNCHLILFYIDKLHYSQVQPSTVSYKPL